METGTIGKGQLISQDGTIERTQQIRHIRKAAKSRNKLTKEQITMLKKEYGIVMNYDNTEADALKLLKGGSFKAQHNVLMQASTTIPLTIKVNGKDIIKYKETPKVLKYTKKGEVIFQNN